MPPALEWRHFDIHAAAVIDGDPIDLQYTAFVYSDGEVFWTYDALVSAFLGPRKSIRPWQEQRLARTKLEVLIADLGIDWQATFVASRRMVSTDADTTAGQYTRNVQCVSSAGMILQHAQWAVFSWRATAKRRALVMGTLICERLLKADCLALGKFDELLEYARPACLGSEGFCPHVTPGSLRQVISDASSPQAGVFLCLCSMLEKAYGCETLKVTILTVLECMVEGIDGGFDDRHVEAEPHKLPTKRTKKGYKKSSDTYRQFVMRKIHKERKAPNGKQVLKLDGFASQQHHSWLRQETGAYMKACQRVFTAKGGVYGIWEDGSRLGNLGKEVVVSFAYSCSDRAGCAMPPQVVQADGHRTLGCGCERAWGPPNFVSRNFRKKERRSAAQGVFVECIEKNACVADRRSFFLGSPLNFFRVSEGPVF